MQRRRAAKNLPPLGKFVMSAYVIVRDTEAEAQAELERIAAEVCSHSCAARWSRYSCTQIVWFGSYRAHRGQARADL